MFLTLLLGTAAFTTGQVEAVAEPNLTVACQWWRDLENIWTPVGWKDHVFRFNVFFDGTILVDPKRHRDRLGGHSGVQITFAPALKLLQPGPDDLSVRQGWRNDPAPVLWSEWNSDGLLLRQEIFAYLLDGKETQTGLEPLFAWVRLSVHDTCPGVPLPATAEMLLKINAPFVRHSMSKRYNIRFAPDKSLYPKVLTSEPKVYDPANGFRLIEEGGLVRLGVAPVQKCSVQFAAKKPATKDSLLTVRFGNTKGSHVDLLLPLVPVEKGIFDQVMAKGFAKALAEANRYWTQTPATAARWQIPEGYINEAIRRNLQMAEIIAEKDPNTGQYAMLTGSWCYGHGLWATPNSIALNFLDILGHQATVEKYLRLFKKEQGTVVPPGPSYKLHAGYLSSPKTLTSVDWLCDHGALLWVIAEHALLTGDPKFSDEWLPVVVKACAFIKDSRRIEGHGGVPGILPAAVATDQRLPLQGVWNDGWNYKGLVTAVRLLKQRGHARAAEFEAEAHAYRAAFQKALRQSTLTMPTWTDANGKVHRQVPTGMAGQKDTQLRHAFHLDAGPLFLVFAGLFDADDELMKSTLAWFRDGPPRRFYRHDADCWQLPSLHHEMSSCEPCYSWNIFHSWQTQDRAKFLEGMYSLFAGAYSRQTYTVCETRFGITGACHWLPSVYLARLAVIDDQIKEQELHLLRLVPLAWLRQDAETVFADMPTEFGPVTLRLKMADKGKELQVQFTPRFRQQPQRVLLHVPPLRGLARIRFNGQPLNWDGKTSQIGLQLGTIKRH